MKNSFAHLVRHAVARHLRIPEACVDPAHRLREDLGLLPLDVVLVALCLEEVASARFPVEHLDSVHTVEALTVFLWSCRCTAPRSPRELAERGADVDDRLVRDWAHAAHGSPGPLG